MFSKLSFQFVAAHGGGIEPTERWCGDRWCWSWGESEVEAEGHRGGRNPPWFYSLQSWQPLPLWSHLWRTGNDKILYMKVNQVWQKTGMMANAKLRKSVLSFFASRKLKTLQGKQSGFGLPFPAKVNKYSIIRLLWRLSCRKHRQAQKYRKSFLIFGIRTTTCWVKTCQKGVGKE